MIVALLAGAAIAHAAWNLVIKSVGSRGAGFLWLTFVAGVVVYAPFGIASLVRSGAAPGRLVLLAAVSGLLQLAYFTLLQHAYRVGDVSIVYPLARGTSPLLSVVLAIVLFGESPTSLSLLAAGVIIVGVVVIGLSGAVSAGGRGTPVSGSATHALAASGMSGSRPTAGRAAPTPRVSHSGAAVGLGMLVGVLIALYTLWDAYAVLRNTMPPIGYYWVTLVVQVLVFSVPTLR